MNLNARYKASKVRRSDKIRAQRMASCDSVALGFAWRAANIGGVRRHLESIEKYSERSIALYPSTYATEVLTDSAERNAYHAGLGAELIRRHALFHSHVDPRFIELSRRARAQGRPWVHTYHSLYFSEDWNSHLKPWQIEINRSLLDVAHNADVCLAVGSWLVSWLHDNHEIESTYLPNGVDLEACGIAEATWFVDRFRARDFVLFVNNISKVKNPLAFIQAAEKFPKHVFVMVGTGLTPQGIKENLGIEIPPNLKALGPLPHAQALHAIAACSVFVMTSHREGLPTVLLEAMSMAKPCVVPDAPWFADAIPSDEYGLLYEPGNLDDLAAKIESAIDRGDCPLARKRVEENFSWPVIARKLDGIYRQLLS